MKSSLLILFVAGTAAIPIFDIDLDLSPEMRWKNVTLFYKREIAAILKAFTKLLDNSVAPTLKTQWLAALDFDAESTAELQGIVNDADSNEVTLDRLKLYHAMYELHTPAFACSGLVLSNANGQVIHGRNMDYMMAYELDGHIRDWPSVTFNALFRKGGVPVLTSVQWAGHIGIHTAMRFDGWTFEQNTRDNHMHLNLAAAQGSPSGSLPPYGLVVRQIMLEIADFEAAVEVLNNTEFIAPQYFIMSGPGPKQGAVVSKDRIGQPLADTLRVRRLGEEGTLGQENAERRQYLMQTNDDINKPPNDPRRGMAMKQLNTELRSQATIDEPFVMNFMRGLWLRSPVTVFTWVANVATGNYSTTLRTHLVLSELPSPKLRGGPRVIYNGKLPPSTLVDSSLASFKE